MKIVLDTNILLISIPQFSMYRPIFDALISGGFTLAISNEIFSEYREVIARKTNAAIANNVAELLINLPNVENTATYFRWNFITVDPDDNKFVDCAVASNADFLVSNDRHFRELRNVAFPSVHVISADDFLSVQKDV